MAVCQLSTVFFSNISIGLRSFSPYVHLSPRPQGKDLSWRSSKVLRVFLHSFPLVGLGGFSPMHGSLSSFLVYHLGLGSRSHLSVFPHRGFFNHLSPTAIATSYIYLHTRRILRLKEEAIVMT